MELTDIISDQTLAIYPSDKKLEESIIYFKGGDSYTFPLSPNKLFDTLCDLKGQQLKREINFWGKNIMCDRKCPVALFNYPHWEPLLFFPILSATNDANHWLSFDHFVRFTYDDEDELTYVQFSDATVLAVPASRSIMQRQISYAASLYKYIHHLENKDFGFLPDLHPSQALNTIQTTNSQKEKDAHKKVKVQSFIVQPKSKK